MPTPEEDKAMEDIGSLRESARANRYRGRRASAGSALVPIALGDWTVELREDGSLHVASTDRGAPKVLTWGDASNSVNVTTLRILKQTAEVSHPDQKS